MQLTVPINVDHFHCFCSWRSDRDAVMEAPGASLLTFLCPNENHVWGEIKSITVLYIVRHTSYLRLLKIFLKSTQFAFEMKQSVSEMLKKIPWPIYHGTSLFLPIFTAPHASLPPALSHYHLTLNKLHSGQYGQQQSRNISSKYQIYRYASTICDIWGMQSSHKPILTGWLNWVCSAFANKQGLNLSYQIDLPMVVFSSMSVNRIKHFLFRWDNIPNTFLLTPSYFPLALNTGFGSMK